MTDFIFFAHRLFARPIKGRVIQDPLELRSPGALPRLSLRLYPRDFLTASSDERYATPVFDKRRPISSSTYTEQRWGRGAMAQQHVLMEKKKYSLFFEFTPYPVWVQDLARLETKYSFILSFFFCFSLIDS